MWMSALRWECRDRVCTTLMVKQKGCGYSAFRLLHRYIHQDMCDKYEVPCFFLILQTPYAIQLSIINIFQNMHMVYFTLLWVISDCV